MKTIFEKHNSRHIKSRGKQEGCERKRVVCTRPVMENGVWGFGCDCVAGGCVKRSPYTAGVTGNELSIFISESKLIGFDT